MSQTTSAAATAITWFEIPTTDFERAKRFYETIFETPLRVNDFQNERIAVFPYERPGVGGCLLAGTPSLHGTVIYLNVDGRLDRTLELVGAAGGRIAAPKSALPPGMGWMAHIVDSEGNRVGLHAMS